MNIIDIYKKIYNLKTYDFNTSSKNSIFFVFFDDNNYYYLTLNEKFVQYSSLLQLDMVDIIDNIESIYKIKVYNFLPLCFTKNNSLVMTCKIKEKSSKLKKLDRKKHIQLCKLLDERVKYYSNNYDDERVLIEKYYTRYKIYQKIIKKYFITDKRRRKKEYLNLIHSLIGDDINSIIDVSCGDNADIFKVCKNTPMVVGNDINYYHIKKNQKKYENIIFTNNNLLNMECKDNFFDVSYCKNTLHHLNGKQEIDLALSNLYKISNKIIIVEIEDPKKSKFMPKFLHKYLYVKYLKDAGKKFLDFNKFREAIDSNYEETSDISYLTFENILGKYMIAVIEKR